MGSAPLLGPLNRRLVAVALALGYGAGFVSVVFQLRMAASCAASTGSIDVSSVLAGHSHLPVDGFVPSSGASMPSSSKIRWRS